MTDNQNTKRGKSSIAIDMLSWMDFPSAVPSILPLASPFKSTAAPSSSSSTKSGQSCPTGWQGLDDMLEGSGLPSHSVIEVIGRSGSGKTQLALSAAVSAAWIGRKVLFVDTANGLNIHRLDQLINLRAVSSNSRTAAHDDVDGNKVAHVVKATKQERGETLGRIAVRTAYDPWELLDVLTQAKGTNPSQRDCIQPAPSYILKTRTPQYDLIIIDCLYPVLSPYINITVPDLKSVSMSGTVGLLGKTVTIEPLIASLGVIFRALGSTGCTVLVMNQRPISVGPPRPVSASLSDVFDIVLSMSVRVSDISVSTGARVGSNGQDGIIFAEVIDRPPYYNMNPTSSEIRISKLCA